MGRILRGLKSVSVLEPGPNDLGIYRDIVRSLRRVITLGLNSVSVLVPCAECFRNLPTPSAQRQNTVVAAGLPEVLDTGQGHMADSWTDKPAAASPVKTCD